MGRQDAVRIVIAGGTLIVTAAVLAIAGLSTTSGLIEVVVFAFGIGTWGVARRAGAPRGKAAVRDVEARRSLEIDQRGSITTVERARGDDVTIRQRSRPG